MDEHRGSREQNKPNEDEWTTVPRGKRRTKAALPKQPGTDRDVNLEKLTANYNNRMRIWKASTCRSQVRQILDRKQPDGGWQIKHAVCLASGSFCRDNWELQRRSMTQFVAFMDLVEHLQETSDEKIQIVAQELIYTPLDIEFLSNLNVTAYSDQAIDQLSYEGPSAKDSFSPDTFVLEPFMDKVLPAVKDLLTSTPKLLVGTSSPGTGAKHLSIVDYNEMRKLYDQFNNDFSYYHFPTFEEDPNIFQGLRISWRNLEDEDEGDND